jgi:sugar phosphate isomerase/epimerase
MKRVESLHHRLGVDIGRSMRLEDGLDWAAAHQVHYVDIQLDTGSNAFTTFDDARIHDIRQRCEQSQIHLGLHTLSAINVAEYSPLVSEAVDAYLRAYIDIAPKLGAEWIVVHAGYHFTADIGMRMQAGLDRLQRMVAHAETKGTRLLLENLNKEPADAEVHYLAHSIDEWRYYYEAIASPAFALSFTANHAHLMPDGIDGFVDAIPFDRVAEVRLADCWRNGHEQHLRPGEGDLDFGDMFRRIEATGFRGHYMSAFGTPDEMDAARASFVADAERYGIS